MKNYFTFILLFFLISIAEAQVSITITKTDTKTPIMGAEIFCNDKSLGKSNENGELKFNTKCKTITVKAKGYYDEEVDVEKNMFVQLSIADAKTSSIAAVTIADVSDPKALAILKKVNDNYEENSPKSLPSYSFKSYEKISMDLDQDSIAIFKDYSNKKLDSIANQKSIKPLSEKKAKDSINDLKFVKLMQQSKFFMWERAMEFLWSKKKGEKTIVLDNRVSGLNQPLYEMMTLRSNRNKIPKEIIPENRKLYRFFLSDSTEIDGRKTFVIRFRSVSNKDKTKRRKFTGLLYVDANSFAVKKIEHNSKVKNEGYISSTWTPFAGKWFLQSETLKLKMGSTSFDDPKEQQKNPNNKKEESENRKTKKTEFGNYAFMKSNYFDFQTPIENRDKDFEGYSLEVKNHDGKLLDQYRTDPLDTRETTTYQKIDSLGKKYKLDQKIGIVSGLVKGKLRLGMFNFDIPQLLKFDLYEGFRATLAVKLNERFSPRFSPDAYIGYGFRDQKWKYGVGLDWKTSLKTNSFFRAEYFDDVVAAGRFNEYLWTMKMGLMNSEVDLNNDKFFHYKGFKLSYEKDISNGLTVNLSVKKQSENALFNYQFDNLGNTFNNIATGLTLKFAPFAKNIMTPTGKFTYEENYPDIYFNYEQGLQSFGGELKYSRVDALVVHQFKTKIGVSGFRLYGGFTEGKTPIWHQFMMNGLGNGNNELNYNMTSYLGFATMPGGKYFNDRFVGTYLTHRIPWYFRTFGKNISSFDVVYRGIIGNMKNPEIQQFQFEKLNHLYQETGLEWNNFLGSQFNIGFFYRVGHYASSDFKHNFAIQLKLKVLGF